MPPSHADVHPSATSLLVSPRAWHACDGRTGRDPEVVRLEVELSTCRAEFAGYVRRAEREEKNMSELLHVAEEQISKLMGQLRRCEEMLKHREAPEQNAQSSAVLTQQLKQAQIDCQAFADGRRNSDITLGIANTTILNLKEEAEWLRITKEEEHTQLVSRINAAQFLLESRQEEIAKLRAELDPLGEQLGRRTQEVARMTDALSRSTCEVKRLQATQANLEQELAGAVGRANRLSQDCCALERRCRSSECQSHRLRETCQALGTEHAALKKACRHLEEQLQASPSDPASAPAAGAHARTQARASPAASHTAASASATETGSGVRTAPPSLGRTLQESDGTAAASVSPTESAIEQIVSRVAGMQAHTVGDVQHEAPSSRTRQTSPARSLPPAAADVRTGEPAASDVSSPSAAESRSHSGNSTEHARRDLLATVEQRYGLRFKRSVAADAVVAIRVHTGGLAHRGGVRAGDHIRQVNGKNVATAAAAAARLFESAGTEVGTSASLVFARRRDSADCRVDLHQLPLTSSQA